MSLRSMGAPETTSSRVFESLFAEEQEAGAGSTTVLLAEDNDDLRTVISYCLEAMGYGVVACCDAEVAFAAFHTRAFDILLTDIEMPGRSGVELARELTALRPALPVMIVSGSDLSIELVAEMRDRGWPFMSKPYHMPVLLKTLRSLVDTAHVQAA